MSVERQLNRLLTLGVGGFFALSAAKSCYYVLDGGQRAIVFDRKRGIMDDIKGPGLHFLIPVWQKVRTRPQPRVPPAPPRAVLTLTNQLANETREKKKRKRICVRRKLTRAGALQPYIFDVRVKASNVQTETGSKGARRVAVRAAPHL